MSHALYATGNAAVPQVPSGSPWVFRNSSGNAGNLVISGGTVTTIEWSRDGSTYYLVGLIAGQFFMAPGDYLRVTYAVAPTATFCPI